MAEQLREIIDNLIQKNHKANAETWKSYEEYEKWKTKGIEQEIEFHWKSYQVWSNQARRLG